MDYGYLFIMALDIQGLYICFLDSLLQKYVEGSTKIKVQRKILNHHGISSTEPN